VPEKKRRLSGKSPGAGCNDQCSSLGARGICCIHASATLKGAGQAGVQAEIDNIAMYERFLAQPVLKEKMRFRATVVSFSL